MSNVDSDDDNKSQASVSSITQQPLKCPFCNWCKGARGLFNHIIAEHKSDMIGCVGSIKDLKDDLEEGNCLHLNQIIEYYAPDDEFKEFMQQKEFELYGCLSCKKTFQVPARSKAHWRTNTKCHKTHIKEVQKIIRKIEEFEDQKKGKEWLQNLTSKELHNCIERFGRWYWRIINCDIPWLESQPMNTGITLPEKYKQFEFCSTSSFSSRGELFKAYVTYSEKTQNLYAFIKKRFTFDPDYTLPSPIGFDDQFDGLPPVGTSFEKTSLVITQDERRKKQEEYEKTKEEHYNKKFLELEQEKIKLHKQMLDLANKEKAFDEKALEEKKPVEEKKPLEPIFEETIGQPKQKRNSFTIPRPDPTELITRCPSPTRSTYPQIISNTKTKREPKRVSSI